MFKNTMKTTVLLAGLGGLIVAVAGLIGGGSVGAFTIGVVIALVMVGGSYWFSDKLALASAKAKVIERADAPEFFDIVASLAQRTNMPMPRVAVSPQPNAFATGRSPSRSAVCVSTVLLDLVSMEELAGVIGHELAHVKNRDTLT